MTGLAGVRAILVVDWPSREVPEALARAGYEVVVHGGPGPEDYTAWELAGDVVVERQVGRPPERADVVYTYRPLAELPGIVEQARALGAGTVWIQSGLAAGGEKDPAGCWLSDADAAAARAVVESAGLTYVDHPAIVDAIGR